MPHKDPEKRKAASRASTKLWRRRYPERARQKSRESNRKSLYGITATEYNQKLVDQSGVCAICGGVNPFGHALYVDHDHETGQVRDLLCQGCNTALGLVKEGIPRLLALVAYLKKWARI